MGCGVFFFVFYAAGGCWAASPVDSTLSRSFSAWKNDVTASTISSRAPSRTPVSWWVVKLIRWSVMRLWGKL